LISIIALAIVAVITLSTMFGITVAKAERSQSVSGSSVFITSGNAEVWSHKITAVAPEDKDEYYSMFVFKKNGDAVNYRKNLAYNWYESVKPETDGETEDKEGSEESLVLQGTPGWFSLKVGFELGNDEKLEFEKFIITFESQQYSQTKDGKTANYIIFVPTETGRSLKVLITDDKDAEVTDAPVIGYDNIEIKFTSYEDGEYAVEINDEEATGIFKNVGGTYSRYSSSTTTPVTPLSFSAVYPEEEEGKDNTPASYARLAIYKLNGQSFKLRETPNETEGHYRNGSINDNTPPVLCLDKGVSFIGLNEEISFNYTVIDVCTSSPSMETSYFMLTKTDAENAEFKANDYKAEGLFTVVSSSDDQKMTPHVKHYIPSVEKGNLKEGAFGKDTEVMAAVKVMLKLTDTSSSGGESTYVMLDWYVKDDMLVTVNGNKYIAVATDKEGASFNYVSDGKSNVDGATWTGLLEDYQAEVDKASTDLKAGSKNYFYLPSVSSLLSDNATAYEDMTYHIYYISNSRQQVSSKAANALSIQLNRAGKYIFTVYATDAQGNGMYYFDKDGEKKEFATSDIWNMYDDDELKGYLPWFTFNVEASEISIEEPKEQATAYVGSSYSPKSFEINGVSYNTTYSLYLFNSEQYYKDNNKTLSYREFMDKKESLINDGENGRKWFTYIFASSEIKEGTEEYEKYHDYNWNKSSPSFVPQDANTFYLIKCEVKSTDNSGTPGATAYMGIASAPKVRTLHGEDTWVQDNMTSIILLCIAGASLIGIVLLLVIKPKNKGDLDEIEATSKKKNKK
ncbi:MAG: hypothetical protein K2K80_07725, partial [Clostridia bacterium]|nr:hypothetical protein [Clostridia bacterium]